MLGLDSERAFNYDTNEYVCPACGEDVGPGPCVALVVLLGHDHTDMHEDVRYHFGCFRARYDAKLPGVTDVTDDESAGG